MTTLQVQHLLAYLGYDPGTADGVLGPKTKAAVYDFQQDFTGLQVDGLPGEETQKALRHAVACGMDKSADSEHSSGTPPDGDFWKDIQYFNREEFRCPCPRCGGFPAEPEEALVRLAERVRGHFALPVTVSSGVRCERHNREVGGVVNSRHLAGKAMDFSVQGVPSGTVLLVLQGLAGVRYAYGIDGSYVHMDVE